LTVPGLSCDAIKNACQVEENIPNRKKITVRSSLRRPAGRSAAIRQSRDRTACMNASWLESAEMAHGFARLVDVKRGYL
jgi:hypothetical protein